MLPIRGLQEEVLYVVLWGSKGQQTAKHDEATGPQRHRPVCHMTQKTESGNVNKHTQPKTE